MNVTQTKNRWDGSGDEVLIAFAEAGTNADLGEWIRRYPEQARDLARLSAERWTAFDTARNTSPESEAATARFREIGRTTVRACRLSNAAPATPLTSLIAAAKARGLEPQAVAAALDLPYALFFKLHRRLIAPDSVPQRLAQRMADTLDRTRDEIAGYLRQPPTLALGASYRSDEAPQAGARESFADALRADPTATPAQQAHWAVAEGDSADLSAPDAS